MKKIIYVMICLLLSNTVLAATYKVKAGGSVTPKKVIKTTTTTTQDYYKNYAAKNYINNQTVLTGAVSTIAIVMDFSGSMSDCVNEAKSTMSNVVAQIPSSTKVGLRVFGHNFNGGNTVNMGKVKEIKKINKNNKKVYSLNTGKHMSTTGACAATEQVSRIMPISVGNLVSGLNSVRLGGATPLTYALQQTVLADFQGLEKNYPKKIVLITDGGENCGGDPCAFAKELMQQRSDIHIDVVLVSSYSKELTCLTSTTGGKFYTLNNINEFSTVLTESMKTAPSTVQTQQQSTGSQNYEFIDY